MRKRKLRSLRANQQKKSILKSKLRSPRANQQEKLEPLSEFTVMCTSGLPMIHQVQPTAISCLPTAFAICLGVPVQRVIDDLGHDTHFFLQGLQVLCLRYGYISMYAAKAPELGREKTVQEEIEYADFFAAFVKQNTGVILGETQHGNEHAVAWDSEFIYDPADGVKTYETMRLTPKAFVLVKRFPKSNIYVPP